MMRDRRLLAALLLTAGVLALLGARPALAAEDGPSLGGYLEETLLGQVKDAGFAGQLLSHLRLKVNWPEHDGLSARGEFDLNATGTNPAGGGETATVPAPPPLKVDRLYLRLMAGPTQATLGRQRIAWGNGTAFAPVDYFNPPNAVDPDGPRQGADGLLVRRSLGALGYVAAAAAYVDGSAALASRGGSGGAGTGGLSGGLKAGAHVGKTDLSLGLGYDALSGRSLAFAEAQGDLGVGWHATAARLVSASGDGEKWTGAAGLDYSFGGKVVTRLEYAAGPAAGAASEQPRWSGAVTYSPDEVTSLSLSAMAETAPGTPRTAVVSCSRIIGDAFDASVRLAWPFGVEQAAALSPLGRGTVEAKVRYSF
ncbi:MAG: hypothetical protein ACM3RP_02815 [Chitinophagales bacterium]